MIQQKIFIASPGDVSDERSIVRMVVERLGSEYAFRNKINLSLIAWDQPGAAVPMQAGMTPQAAIAQGLEQPSECDLVLALFWSRIGTPLPSEDSKADGSRYLSGTEWEYLDAMQAYKSTGTPLVWVYRRLPPKAIMPDASDFQEQCRQWQQLQAFFAPMQEADQSINSGINVYETPADFQSLLEQHLRDYLMRLIEQQPVQNVDNGNDVQAQPQHELWQGVPYPGLEAFTEQQAPVYFGRERETDALLRLISDVTMRCIAVVGASGSGKSSLVAAGLIARLQKNALPGSRKWCYLRFTPTQRGSDPFMALADAMRENLPGSGFRAEDLAQSLFAQAVDNADSTFIRLLENRPASAEVLLFIDQFEELFNSAVDPVRRECFILFLKHCAVTPRVRLVITIRADFYPHITGNLILAECFQNNCTLPLAAPGIGAMHKMISGPAQMAGLRLKDDLVETILDKAGAASGALPLMAFALSEMYKNAKVNGELTPDDFTAVGEIEGAVAQRAEGIFAGLGFNTEGLQGQLFAALVTLSKDGVATRKRADLTRLNKNPQMQVLIKHLADARLLVSGDEELQPTVEIAHEALLDSWPRLSDWIKANRDLLSAEADLRAAEQTWRRSGQPRWSGLASGNILKRFLRVKPTPKAAEAFLKACQKLRLYRLAAMSLMVLLIVGGISFVVWKDHHDLSSTAAVYALSGWLGYFEPMEPTMVRIPRGKFKLGSSEQDQDAEYDKKSQLVVEIKSDFYISQYETTFDQYDAYRVLHNVRKPSDQGWGRGKRPVIDVTWNEAMAYAHWLATQTDKNYRLPTEVEWEYAAKGPDNPDNPDNRYPWGGEIGIGKANCKGCGGEWDGQNKTAPVGSFQAYGYGLYDTAGNVWEWTCSSYSKADGGAEKHEKSCEKLDNLGGRRVVRGGSWLNGPRDLRSAVHDGVSPDGLGLNLGFRLAQD